ncbi:MAG: SUMF1/EgtB/PvdO family nonheme iron enzyme [bacterium]|nr:SUMF1/EgtB/PvdO family nonheme iron enzyme [bacterium]
MSTRPGVEKIFARALRQPTTRRRRAFVRECAGPNQELAEEALSLLDHLKAAETFLEVPLAESRGFAGNGARAALGAGPEVGDSIGPYRIEAVLGEGGMGVVYLAHQRTPVDRRVALKVLKPGMDSREVVARFEQERQALAIMGHPGIAAVFDAGVTETGRPYFAMEQVDGLPITSYCNHHRLDPRARVRLFAKVCGAVQHAHEKGIIHRDLKPSNILVPEADDPQPKVIDFGIAKALDQPLTEKTLHTCLGTLMGTPAYMSPEQADLWSPHVDTRSDIYSLGVVLFELLCGDLPYEEIATRPGVASQRWTQPVGGPPAPSRRLQEAGAGGIEVAAGPGASRRQLAQALRGDLDAIVQTALAGDREQRYSSVSELLADLERHLRGDVVLARGPSVGYRLRCLVRRHRAFFGGIAAVFLALILGLVVSTHFYVESQTQRSEVLRLSDRELVVRVLREADQIWPADPENIERMERWLTGDSRRLAKRAPQYQRELAELRSRGGETVRLVDLDASGRPVAHEEFADVETQFRYQLLSELVQQLEHLSRPETGQIARMHERLAFARGIRRQTLEEPRELWEGAIASIADREQSPAYGGLRIAPQLGLVPIGPDPNSGLWEFAHLRTGEIPRRGGDGRLRIDGGTGLVFVLMPPGTFRMGAEEPPEDDPDVTGPNLDRWARSHEKPVHEVTLGDPFFLSKYEMTQGQWLRVNHDNPSARPAGEVVDGRRHTLRHPVEKVTWWAADKTMQRLGLTLPTEAQWEYAARAGTSSVWWAGDHIEDVRGIGNIGDQRYYRTGRIERDRAAPWDDGYQHSAPVGIYRANPFGLHDTVGNVWEWCRDYGSFSVPVRATDGLRLVPPEIAAAMPEQLRVFRGGGYDRVGASRTAARYQLHLSKEFDIGLRPARAVAKKD